MAERIDACSIAETLVALDRKPHGLLPLAAGLHGKRLEEHAPTAHKQPRLGQERQRFSAMGCRTVQVVAEIRHEGGQPRQATAQRSWFSPGCDHTALLLQQRRSVREQPGQRSYLPGEKQTEASHDQEIETVLDEFIGKVTQPALQCGPVLAVEHIR